MVIKKSLSGTSFCCFAILCVRVHYCHRCFFNKKMLKQLLRNWKKDCMFLSLHISIQIIPFKNKVDWMNIAKFRVSTKVFLQK